jgi:hypothetical protein
MSISWNWEVLLAYLLLNYLSWICIRIWKKNSQFLFDHILCIVYNIQIQCIISCLNTGTIYYSNTMRSLELTFYSYILYLPLPWQWLRNNNFFQAYPFKYLIEHENVKSYILLNMNVSKITNDVLCQY